MSVVSTSILNDFHLKYCILEGHLKLTTTGSYPLHYLLIIDLTPQSLLYPISPLCELFKAKVSFPGSYSYIF
jgi:hypothetical protein